MENVFFSFLLLFPSESPEIRTDLESAWSGPYLVRNADHYYGRHIRLKVTANVHSRNFEFKHIAVTCASKGGPAASCRPYCILNGYKSGYCDSKGNCTCTKWIRIPTNEYNVIHLLGQTNFNDKKLIQCTSIWTSMKIHWKKKIYISICISSPESKLLGFKWNMEEWKNIMIIMCATDILRQVRNVKVTINRPEVCHIVSTK